jgi:hypothetical protein
MSTDLAALLIEAQLPTAAAVLPSWLDRAASEELSYADFLHGLLVPTLEALRTWVLEQWCHRTGGRSRETPTPLYRLRSALSRLWLAYPWSPHRLLPKSPG